MAYDEVYNGLVTDPSEGNRLAAKFCGKKRVLFHRHHGVFVAGGSMAQVTLENLTFPIVVKKREQAWSHFGLEV